MKYIYYIIAIVVIFSAMVGYGLLNTKVQISKPALVINDRVISENEYQELLLSRPVYMSEDQYIDSVIAKELFIQEAIKLNINKEESFRKSVENFYEQSLVKILLDRQLNSFQINVTDAEIQKYSSLLGSRVILIKTMLPEIKDNQENNKPSVNRIVSDFVDLSDDLKFIVFKLNESESTEPIKNRAGKEFEEKSVTYLLEKIEIIQGLGMTQDMDIPQITEFLSNKKKEDLLDRWTSELRNHADIWRK